MCVDEIANILLQAGFPIRLLHFFDSATCSVKSCEKNLVPHVNKNDILYAIFDMSCNIASFDTLTFVVWAEMERQKRGLKYIHFIILPRISASPTTYSFRSNYSEEDERWRLSHIVLPILESVDSTLSVTKLAFREEFDSIFNTVSLNNIFPDTFLEKRHGTLIRFDELDNFSKLGRSFEIISAQKVALSLVDSFLKSHQATHKKLITFTIREYDIHPERNSDYNDWVTFAKGLDPEKYFCVLIRDTYKSAEKLPEELSVFTEYPLASIDIAARIAIYQASYINLGSTNGPSYLSYFIKGTASIRFLTVSDDHFASSKETLNQPGFHYGEEPCFALSPRHIVIWETENLQTISHAFKELSYRLEN